MSVQFTGNNATIPGIATIGSILANMLKLVRATVSLTVDDQEVDITGISYLALSSDDVTAANRDFVLNQGASGQVLVIEWTGTNAAQFVDGVANSDAGNVRLSATWTPTQYDTLVLISNGTDWLEVARSTN